ncbi:hypothetical protein BDV96DRAFT_186553 [Lophiotrema nucula]|uniref:Uncharacterized protein n=1 Tax=Lophiotrema nucula TaxID=690887 RepID=A0A6A5YV58_9PLEO|nr:hypothetical protein BDV96DRAFT_186553 [Lophiotrema nucula]
MRWLGRAFQSSCLWFVVPSSVSEIGYLVVHVIPHFFVPSFFTHSDIVKPALFGQQTARVHSLRLRLPHNIYNSESLSTPASALGGVKSSLRCLELSFPRSKLCLPSTTTTNTIQEPNSSSTIQVHPAMGCFGSKPSRGNGYGGQYAGTAYVGGDGGGGGHHGGMCFVVGNP